MSQLALVPVDDRRYGTCRRCSRTFGYPLTGPPRIYCDHRCRDAAHAERVPHELDQDGLPGVGVPFEKPPRNRNDFGLRFRDCDPLAQRYELVLHGDPCSYCGVIDDAMEADHIESFGAGGSGEWPNLTAACKQCNSSKCDQPLLLWLLNSPRLMRLRFPQLDLLAAS